MALSYSGWFKKNRLLWALMASIALAACGQHAAPRPVSPPDGDHAPQMTSTYTTEAGGEEAVLDAEGAAAPAPAAEASSDISDEGGSAEMAPAAPPKATADLGRAREASRSRPGLGTEWGEDRASHIHHTSFDRAEPSRPFGIATLFYNDRAGINAMARESSISDHGDSGFDVLGGAATVRLLDGSGHPLPAFQVASRDYVVGEHGQRYVIEVRNHTGGRLEVVATVDGLDVVDGETGSLEKRGYVVNPFATLTIDGFRRSMDTVAAFRFGSVRDSYAAKKGKARNVGVVGVAFFHERGSDLPWTGAEVHRRHSADPFPGRFAAPPPN